MHLTIHRTYYEEGTNGLLTMGSNSTPLCHTIELPWRDNQPNRSCIPLGTYVLRKRYSNKFRWHIEVTNVPGRSLILIHPANHATRELKGCIAPVLQLTGPGRGLYSRMVFNGLIKLVFAALKRNETVLLTITEHNP